MDNVRLANKDDMGVFVISVFDKGGGVYAPSYLCREFTLPDMKPMGYGARWLWYHDTHFRGGGGGGNNDAVNGKNTYHRWWCRTAK